MASTFKIVKNREWINTCCYRGDEAAIDRMFRNDLEKFGPGIGAPMWEKEKFYYQWLEMDFSTTAWQKAKTPSGTSGGWIGLDVGNIACGWGTKIA